MSRLLYRLGHWAARHPWKMVGAWVVAAVLVFAAQGAVGGSTTDNFKLPGTETQRASDLLQERFPAQAGESSQVVFAVDDGAVTDADARAAITATLDVLRASDRVSTVSDPFDPAQPTVSADGRVAFATVVYVNETLQSADFDVSDEAADIARARGVQAELGGAVAMAGQHTEGNEMVGLLVAVIVLLAAFGSIIAAGIPIGTALFGLVIGLTGVGVLAGFADVPTVSPMLATMIGIGVGIDYALFVVTRFREHIHAGHDVADAAGRANATAGQAVLFAGTTVVIAILGLQLAGIPAIATMGFATAIVVAVAMVAAVTLLPAFLGTAGLRIDRWKIGRARTVEADRTISGRWAHHVGRRPVRYALGSLVALLALTVPLFSMRVGFADDGNAARDTTQRKAYDLLAEGFGPGFNGQLNLVVEIPAGAERDAYLAELASVVQTDPNVAFVAPPVVSPSGDTAVMVVTPRTSPQDEATEELVHRLRDDVLPAFSDSAGGEVLVAGWTAAGIDISDKLVERLPWFIAAVVVLSFLLLMVVFRSVLVPLKAALMNLLSIGAAYGVVIAVFQWGWGKDLIGLDETVPVNPFVPLIMFAILFGLSMDYEVFLLSRVREEFTKSRDSHTSVVDGLQSTARVITSAALIMISVFGAFVASGDVMMKMFGVGLATAVFIDATIVRLVLVPSTMSLLGSANWWLPRWLDRLLPHLDLEGESGLDLPETAEEERELVAA